MDDLHRAGNWLAVGVFWCVFFGVGFHKMKVLNEFVFI